MILAMRSKILKFNAFSPVWHTPNMVIASAARLDRFRLRDGLWIPLRGVKWTGEARQLQFLVLVETTSKDITTMASSKRFERKTEFITGAASGSGRATAVGFAAEGARVVVTD